MKDLSVRSTQGGRWIVPLSAAIALLWTTYTASRLAAQWGWALEKVNPSPMWISQVLSVPLLACLLTVLFKWKTLDRRLTGIFALYALWFLFLFLSFAPGCMTEDSYYTLHMVKTGWWEGWYSPLHPALFTAFMQIIPWGAYAPGIFLALLWAVVFTMVHGVLFQLDAKKLVHFFLPIMILLPAQMIASLVIIRDSYFTALFLVFLLVVFKAIKFHESTSRSTLMFASLLGGILMVYRTDAIPSIALGLIIVAMFSVKYGRLARTTTIATVALPVVFAFSFTSAIPHLLAKGGVLGNSWGSRAENEYKLTLIENPLGYIIKHPGNTISHAEKAAIEKIYNFSDLATFYCPGNLCVFYGEHWNQASTKAERNAAFKAALGVFAKHPILFLKSRLATLNTVGDKNTQTVCSRQVMSEKGYPPLDVVKPVHAFGQLMIDYVHAAETPNGVWWNVYLYAIVCAIAATTIFRTPASSAAMLLLLIRTGVVAIAAPAGFSVYYLTLFIGTPMLLMLWILELRAYRLREPAAGAETERREQGRTYG